MHVLLASLQVFIQFSKFSYLEMGNREDPQLAFAANAFGPNAFYQRNVIKIRNVK